MKIAFAGTPYYAEVQLAALLKTHHDIVVVYTQPDKPAGRGQQLQLSPVKTLGLAHGLPIEQPATLKTEEALNIFTHYAPDVMVVAAYGLILPEAFLKVPRLGCVNLHASLLPRWRGASPIQQAILAGDMQTGITLMQMNKGCDTGGILAQLSCPILPEDTALSLQETLTHLAARLLIAQIDHLDMLKPHPQDETQVTHAGKIHKEDAVLQWTRPAIELERQIRAYNPWPIAHASIDGNILRIWQAHVVPFPSQAHPGTIVAHTPQGIIVATKEEGLLLTQAQLPGKKCLPFSEILNSKRSLFSIGYQFD